MQRLHVQLPDNPKLPKASSAGAAIAFLVLDIALATGVVGMSIVVGVIIGLRLLPA